MRTTPFTAKEINQLKENGQYKKDNPEAMRIRWNRHNPRTYAITKIARKLANTKKHSDFMDLPKYERLQYRAMAAKQYDRENLKDLIYNIAPPLNWTRTKRLLPEIDRPKSKRVTEMQVNDPRGFVYIFKDHMKDEGLYKIGCSYKVRERLDQASVWGDFESVYESEEVPDCVKLEKEVHQSLRKYQAKGEWFKVSEDLAINTIKELVNENFNYAIAS